MKRLSIIAAFAVCASLALAFSVGSGDGIHPHGPVAGAPGPTAIIVLENKPASKITASSAPYLTSFAKQGLRLSAYREASSTGPSLPDYLQLTAGSSCGKTSDSVKAPDPTIESQCPTNLWSQLAAAGISYGVFAELLPKPCSTVVTAVSNHDQYALKHVPAPMWGQCAQPLTAFDPATAPDVSFITPSICNDMHGSKATWAPANCYPGSAALIHRGDDWVAARVPAMLAAGIQVFITFDESGVLYAAVQGGGVMAGVDSNAYTHYSWLRAIEERYGLPLLRGAATARSLPL